MMSRPSAYTPEQDATINRMSLAGESWEAIGRHFGITGNAIMQRARRQNMSCWIKHTTRERVPVPVFDPFGRNHFGPHPLPFMHPISWSLLTQITPSIGAGA